MSVLMGVVPHVLSPFGSFLLQIKDRRKGIRQEGIGD